MSAIVQRLREEASLSKECKRSPKPYLYAEAADEIERLQAVVDHPIVGACISLNCLQFPQLANNPKAAS